MIGQIVATPELGAGGCRLERLAKTLMLAHWLTLHLFAASAPVAVFVECHECGIPSADVRALQKWLSKGLEQGGHPPAVSVTPETPQLLVQLSPGEWSVELKGAQPGSAAVPAGDFHVAALETVHVAAALLESNDAASSSESVTTTSSSGAEPSQAIADEPALLSTDRPVIDASAVAQPPSVANSTEHDRPVGSPPSVSPWRFAPRLSAGVLQLESGLSFSLGAGSRVLEDELLGLDAEVVFVEGHPIESLTVRDHLARLIPKLTVYRGSSSDLEFGGILGLDYHTTRYRKLSPTERWQSLVGVLVGWWYQVGPAELGVRGFAQLSAEQMGLGQLHEEPYQLGLELLIGAEP